VIPATVFFSYSCQFCGGQCGTGKGFVLSVSFHQCCVIFLSLMLCTPSNWQDC